MRKLDYPFEDHKSELSRALRTETEMFVFISHWPRAANSVWSCVELSELAMLCGICEQFVVEAFKNFD